MSSANTCVSTTEPSVPSHEWLVTAQIAVSQPIQIAQVNIRTVNSGATVDRLSAQINSIIGNDQPDIVCLMAGTNIVGNGEKPQNVLNKVKGFVATVQKKCLAAQVVVAGLVHREDKPHL